MVNDVNIQGSLFADEPRRDTATCKSRREIHEDYDGFVEKFKPRKTTDDCYTPQPVYDAVLGWLRENADIEGREIVRPFWPGGDYEHYDYPDGCVVVDNPPFSIFTQVCDARVTYENGACVDTSFASNLFGDIRIMTAPDLLARIKNAAKTKRRLMDLPKYIYPDNVVSAALLGKIAPYVKFEVRASECRRVRKLDNQKGGGIYGGGYLLSDKATARKIEAYEQAAKQKRIITELE